MTDITVPAPIFDFSMETGSSRTQRFTISGAPDLSLAGTFLTFTAVRKPGDATAIIRKTYQSNPLAAVGITIQPAVGLGVFDVQIAPTDTAGLTRTTLLSYEVWFEDPSGNEQCVAKGTIRVRLRADTAVPPAV